MTAIFHTHDGSHYQYEQGTYNWKLIRAASADQDNAIAIYKATQSLTFVDPYLRRARVEMQEAGFKYRLFYPWLSSTTDVVGQVHHYLDTMGPLDEGEGCMVDDEEAGVTLAKSKAFKAEYLRNSGRDAIGFYTGAYVAQGSIYQDPDLMDDDTLRVLAAYTSEASMLQLPGVRTGLLPDMWQFRSSGILPSGLQCPGITGRGDLNMHYRPDAVLAKLQKICGIKPKAVPNPLPPIVNTIPPIEEPPPVVQLPPDLGNLPPGRIIVIPTPTPTPTQEEETVKKILINGNSGAQWMMLAFDNGFIISGLNGGVNFAPDETWSGFDDATVDDLAGKSGLH